MIDRFFCLLNRVRKDADGNQSQHPEGQEGTHDHAENPLNQSV
jgi:hypothetical protein